MLQLLKQLFLATSLSPPFLPPPPNPTPPNATFPLPPGPYTIGTRIHELHSPSLLDPFAPIPHPRITMLTTFYPTSSPPTLSPYMPPGTSSAYSPILSRWSTLNISLSTLSIPAVPNAPPLRPASFPLLLLSPGGGISRYFYTELALALARRGYVVAAADHAYESEAVELLNGTILRGVELDYGGNATLQALGLAMRVADVRAAVDYLGGEGGMDVRRVGVVGHSFGGATASGVAVEDGRVAGVASLDGSFVGRVAEEGLGTPLLLLAMERHDGYPQRYFEFWKVMWGRLREWKRWVVVRGTQHGSISDLGLIFECLCVRGRLPRSWGEILGDIEGKRINEIGGAYVGAFFDKVLKGKETGLFEGGDKRWPEVKIVRK